MAYFLNLQKRLNVAQKTEKECIAANTDLKLKSSLKKQKKYFLLSKNECRK